MSSKHEQKQDYMFGGPDFSSFYQAFKMPGVNFDTMMATHKKNVEALNTAQQASAEMMRNLLQLNSQYLKHLFEEMNTQARSSMGNGGVNHEKMGHQTEAVKTHVDKALRHSREVTEMLNQSTARVLDIYAKRFREYLDEAKEGMKCASSQGGGTANGSTHASS
ncbi:MAG: phasin family protein [Alphaproteobacteria bacterium]